MLALSIRQPWAWLIIRPDISAEHRAAAAARGHIKPIENRCWPTRYRGRFAVHASKGMTRAEYAEAADFAVIDIGIPADQVPALKALQRGGIIGTADIVDCVTASPSPWFFGEYGFVLASAQPCEFVPFKGALGFFEVPDELVREVF